MISKSFLLFFSFNEVSLALLQLAMLLRLPFSFSESRLAKSDNASRLINSCDVSLQLFS